MDKVRFGVIGTGAIVGKVITGGRQHPDFEVLAVCSRSEERGKAFAAVWGIPKVYTSLDAMVLDPELDAIYIASPNYAHCSQAIACMRHGKHVLCEKPLASNAREAAEMIACARENGVALMEAMISTLNPNFRAMREELPRAGKIRHCFASYCQYSSRYDKYKNGIVENAFKNELSNGSVMDIGIYTIYPMVALFGRPISVKAQSVLMSTGVDAQGCAVLKYTNAQAEGAEPSVEDAFNVTVMYSKICDSILPTEICGEEGSLLLDKIHIAEKAEFIPAKRHSAEGCTILRQGLEKNPYYYEFEEFISMLMDGRTESSVNTLDNSLATLEIIDEIRRQAGVSYPADR